MAIRDAQVRKLMEELSKHGEIGKAALRSGMDRKTARKYAKAGKLPSEMKEPRRWRTREDPFEADWPWVLEVLETAPELRVKTVFELLLSKAPERYHTGQLRTLQRRVRQWRASSGPPKEVFFAQEHRPGEAGQTDFTNADELNVTVGGEPFPHLLCHFVLPYSNWQWATACRSESMVALRRGVQAAVFELGRVPEFHQTDNSTAATHRVDQGKKRGFNDNYLALMRHLDMTPRTIAVGEKHQNGDVEAANGALKRRVKQHLLVRSSSDFESIEAYESWLRDVLRQANRLRSKRVTEELSVMRAVRVQRLAEYSEEDVLVTSWSTIRVKHNTYSVPSRLIGEYVRVRLYDDRVEAYFAGERQLLVERLVGRGGQRINYRHVIWSLVRKPGAFPRYRYRDELFPTLTFRRAYDALTMHCADRQADIDYLRVLHLAASTMESDVEAALALLLDAGDVPRAERVKALVQPRETAVPDLGVPEVDLRAFDDLLASAREVAR